jgi:hypothetical protein
MDESMIPRVGNGLPGPNLKFCVMLAGKGKVTEVRLRLTAMHQNQNLPQGGSKKVLRLLVTCFSPVINGVQWA